MNTTNLTFLQDSLKYLGFGEKTGLREQLKHMIVNGEKEFKLSTAYNYEGLVRMEADLYFRKGDKMDLYFFNKYEARMLYSEDPANDKSQIFYLSKGRGVTRKEALNLLQGRSVNKNLYSREGALYNAWIQLDFNERMPKTGNYKTRKYYESYGFDLEKALEHYSIREMDLDPLKSGLLRSLRRGNLHTVTISKDHPRRMLVEANPQYKTINLYQEKPAGQIAVDSDYADMETLQPEIDDRNINFWDEEEEEEESTDAVPESAIESSRRKKLRKKAA